jgi:SNF2 family DNA or RNA helicase
MAANKLTLEGLSTGTRLTGLAASGVATVESVQWIGQQALRVIFRDGQGQLAERLLYRDDEPSLDVVETGRPWSFDGDGDLLRLVSEAYRINLAWLFDPYVAITTSIIEPLPHQIAAVYEEMLPRQPMRFLLADDPGAGKTIMAGLLIKELKVRGDLERCLIIAPGSLTEQWEDELDDKFGLNFDILSNDMIQAARSANPFEHKNYLIARMDQLARNVDIQEKLKAAPEWDLVICDEAHRMSGHFFGTEIRLTKRYHLGRLVGGHCRNFLLMTATPHNGKEEDFQIFMALLDGDRFEGKFRDSVHTSDPSDLMRRMVKEDLLRFDGKKLFPERHSYTAQYELSLPEARLYSEVTDYVREEMNRVERREAEEGRSQQRVNVGFALMILQRRLASSPEAIYRSLKRRHERLESRLREARILLRGGKVRLDHGDAVLDTLDESAFDDAYDEAPQDEREELEARLVDNATAAATIEELEIEIKRLKELETLAREVVRSEQDAKWNQLNSILDDPLMVDENGHRRKLVIFSEFKDTLTYLGRRIRNRLGRDEVAVEIHGSVTREERRRVVHRFMNDPEVLVLIANDAAGEGVNLQRAHLMINYDLPWNPNRLEQRFGRIHRIGQREVCHLWNLIAKDTREGDVYFRLLEKLEIEREALGGKVYDVLGRLFDQKALRDLLMDAVLYGSDPEVKARLDQVVDGAMNHEHLQAVLAERALVNDSMDTTRIEAIREEMERAYARRLQPHFIRAFFLDAFSRLGGAIHRREEGRWEITHVPVAIRERDRHIGMGVPVLNRYERVCFEKDKVDAQPRAELICPGSPLLDATIDLILERYGELMKRGAVLVGDDDPSDNPRLLFYLEHGVQDGRQSRRGGPLTISKRLQFVEVDPDGVYRQAGSAPYLDYRAVTEAELSMLDAELDADWLKRDWEQEVMGYAIAHVIPGHLDEVKAQRLEQIEKIEREVQARLTKEISYWDRRAQDLKERERAGRNTRLPAAVAEERADRLADRLQSRLAELQRERHIVPGSPQIKGGVLIIPRGLLEKLQGRAVVSTDDGVDAEARRRVELIAMEAVLAAEKALGREPRDVSTTRGIGHDLESRASDGSLVFIEVKGRAKGADQVTLTTNEIRRANNVPEQFRLAVVLVENNTASDVVYVRDFDFGEPGFAQASSSYYLNTLLQHGGPPA